MDEPVVIDKSVTDLLHETIKEQEKAGDVVEAVVAKTPAKASKIGITKASKEQSKKSRKISKASRRRNRH